MAEFPALDWISEDVWVSKSIILEFDISDDGWGIQLNEAIEDEEKVPSGQTLHEEYPLAGAWVPLGQGWHIKEFGVAEKKPAGQGRHS